MVIKHPVRGFLHGARMLYDQPPTVAPWNAVQEGQAEERSSSSEPIKSFVRLVEHWRRENPPERSEGEQPEREAYVFVVGTEGTKFVPKCSTIALDAIRISSHLNVTEHFLRWLVNCAVRAQGKPWRVLELLTARAVESPPEEGLAAGLPCARVVGTIMRLVMGGPTVHGYVQGLRQFSQSLGEYSDVMVDMTFKAAAGVTGQPGQVVPGSGTQTM